ncbi:uncharacterized protein LOC127719304, partial [Mytilus californianus]|uniref:uncharacterized protein LOC127719304 n=1 Tax=Mytilus californianus TaxID=6549 RepID=UPI002245CA77
GTITDGTIFPATGRRTVIVMNHEGKRLREYEFDRRNKPLFTVPMYITSTNSGDIFVVDKVDATNRGRVVILDRLGDIIQIYTGQPDFEMERKPFNPRDLIVTPSDTIIVADINNNTLHCLNYDRQIITYYDMSTIGIKFPHSLGLLSSGTIFVGCITVAGRKHATKANIFELEYSEIEY